MVTALSPKRWALVSGFMAIVQLAGAVIAGVSFTREGDGLLATASTAFTVAVMLVNRWYFRGWREVHQARRKKHPPRISTFQH